MHSEDDEEITQARQHYTRAEVDGCIIYELNDDAYVKVSLNSCRLLYRYKVNVYASDYAIYCSYLKYDLNQLDCI